MWVQIPGLAEAIKRENDIRDAAFLDLTTDICGIEIRQMTPRDLLILDGIGNPLLNFDIPTLPHFADFLWKLRSGTGVSPVSLNRFFHARRCRKIYSFAAVEACWKYLRDTFQDSPASSGAQSTPYAGWCAHLVISISENRGWSEQAILNTPLKRLFQYLKVIRRKNDADAPMHNPSDKVKGDYQRLLNARSQLVNLLAKRARN